MILSYQYPVVYFYSDDPEDSEVIQKEGCIETHPDPQGTL